MATKIEVTTFDAQTSSGTHDVTISGFGTPKAAIFIVNRANQFSATTNDAHAALCIGATDGTNEFWCSGTARNGQGTSDTKNRGGTNGCIAIINPWDGGVNALAEFDSWITDGVRIDFTNAASTGFKITCILFGGDGVDAYVGTDTLNESVGSSANIDTGSVEPNALLLFSHRHAFDDTARDEGTFTIGAAVDKANGVQRSQFAWNWSEGDGQSTSAAQSNLYTQSGSLVIQQNNNNAEGNAAAMEVTEFSPSGNATSFEATQRTATGTLTFGFVALNFSDGNIDFLIGDLVTPRSTGSQSTSGLGGKPIFAMRCLTQMTDGSGAYDATGKAAAYGIAVSDGTTSVSHGVTSEDGASTTDAKSWANTQFAHLPEHGGVASDRYSSSLTSFDYDGWTENWDDVTSDSKKIPTFAVLIVPATGSTGTVDAQGAETPNQTVIATETANGTLSSSSRSPSVGPLFAIGLSTSYDAVGDVARIELRLESDVSAEQSVAAALDGGLNLQSTVNAEQSVAVALDLGINLASDISAEQSVAVVLDGAPGLETDVAAEQSVAAALDGGVQLQASIAAEQSVAAALDAGIELQSTIDAEESVTASLDLVPGLQASVDAEQSVAAALDGGLKLEADIAAEQSVTAALDLGLDLSSTVDAEQSVTVALDGVPGLETDVAAEASVAVALDGGLNLSATISAEQSVVADLDIPDAGELLIELDPIGAESSVAVVLDGVPGIDSDVSAEQSVAAVLDGVPGLQATIDAEQAVTAALDAVPGLQATISAEQSVTVDLVLGGELEIPVDAINAEQTVTATLIFCSEITVTPTTLDAILLPQVLAIVEELGKVATFYVLSSKVYDRTTGASTETLDAAYTARVTPPFPLDLQFAPREVIRDGDVEFLLPAQGLNFNPDLAQRFTLDGLGFDTVSVQRIYSGQKIVAYAILGRGGGGTFAAATGSTTLDEALVPAVFDLVDELGKEITIETRTRTYDGDTGATTLGASASQTVKSTPPDQFELTLENADLIRDGAARVLVPGQSVDFDLERGQTAAFDGRTFHIGRIRPIFSGERVALWELALLGGTGDAVASSTTTGLDDVLVPETLALVNELGLEARFYLEDESYDRTTGRNTPTQRNPKIHRVTPPEMFGADDQRHYSSFGLGDLIKDGDARAFLPGSGLSFEPKQGQRVLIDCETWYIVGTQPFYSGEQVVLYGLQLRR